MVGVKDQSNQEIARSPRNAFRCSVGVECHRGRATDWARGLHRLPNLINSECYDIYPAVRAWVLRSMSERERTQTIC